MKISPEYIQLRKVVSSYVSRYPAPTMADNRNNLEKLAKLDKKSPEYRKLREYIILSNGGFAMKYVFKYINVIGEENLISELFQEATIGIAETIDSFDVTKKTSFTTYAFFHVKKRLIDYIKKYKLVKAPREIAKNIRNVSTAIENLSNALGREPSVYEIRDQLEKKDILIDELTISEIRTLIDLNSGNDDQFISEYKEQYIEEPESELINLMKINILKDFEKLSKNVAEELDMRFGITYDHPFNKEEVDYILYAKPKRL